MAESQTPAAAPAVTKPVKPDQDAFNEKLAQAEKEYQEALKKYVSPLPWPLLPDAVESEHASSRWIAGPVTMHPSAHGFPPRRLLLTAAASNCHVTTPG